ncbi:unnamed protein product [Mytilus coruscus]|uniref:DZIP3-like HEPN domain-containing protein n=1 Tax=Mytilus coruscus TaxID=42192 RepID=A0A6J8D506_MYTCO|nr:unnamed protein product [Mytilus coruscus]
MSTNTREAQELLRLFKCLVDTGTDVVGAFATHRLLPTYNGSSELFLEDKKHETYHLWQPQKLLCCACPAAGCNLKRMSPMDNWIFKKIYDDNGPEHGGHIVRNSRKVVQVCLHKYIKRNIAIHELDISAISFLLRNLANLSQNENTALDIITTERSQICHAYSMNCYPKALMNTKWTELENALILQKVKSSSNNNVTYLNGMETRLRNNTDAINQHTTEETSYYAAQAQQALSEKIQNTEENLQKEAKEVKKISRKQLSKDWTRTA